MGEVVSQYPLGSKLFEDTFELLITTVQQQSATGRRYRDNCRASFPQYVMENRKTKIEAALVAVAEEMTPEVGICVDGVVTGENPLNAYWHFVGLHSLKNAISMAVRSDDPQQAVATIALVVDGKVKRAAIISVLGPIWYVKVTAGKALFYQDGTDEPVVLNDVERKTALAFGKMEFGGERGEYSSPLFDAIFGWYNGHELLVPYADVSSAVSLTGLLLDTSVMHLQPPGTDSPGVIAAIKAVNDALGMITLRPADDVGRFMELTYDVDLSSSERNYPVVTIHASRRRGMQGFLSNT